MFVKGRAGVAEVVLGWDRGIQGAKQLDLAHLWLDYESSKCFECSDWIISGYSQSHLFLRQNSYSIQKSILRGIPLKIESNSHSPPPF